MITPRLKVAVVGGGIGGLTTVVALSKSPDIEVDLYEATNEFTELGAGLGLWGRVWKVLEKLGIGSDLADLTSDPLDDEPRLTYRYRRSDRLEGTDLYELSTTGGLPFFHRGELQKTILKHLPPSCRCHMSKRLVSYTDASTGPILLQFQDGTTATCDLLVGADGVRSAVRASLLKSLPHPWDSSFTEDTADNASDVWFSGTLAFRGLAPQELVRALAPNHRALSGMVMYCGKSKHVAAYPISQGRWINVVPFLSDPSLEGKEYHGPWMVETSNEDMLDIFAGFEDEVKILLQCMEKPKRFAMHSLKPLSSYVSGRVALLGDSAHSMTPHQVSGAGQAIEDAYILGALLSDPACTPETLPCALEVYSQIRLPAASRFVQGSRANGMLFDLVHPGLDGMTEENLKPLFIESLQGILKQWQTAWTTTAEDDRERAIEMFKKNLQDAQDSSLD